MVPIVVMPAIQSLANGAHPIQTPLDMHLVKHKGLESSQEVETVSCIMFDQR